MAVKIRLARHGAKKRPYYRIVVADSRARRDGRFIEEVGRYNPCVSPSFVSFKQDRLEYQERARKRITRMAEQSQDLAGLVESIVRPLIDHEDELVITSSIDDNGSNIIEIEVNEEDAGKVIGRQGRVIKSIRTLARAAASRNDMHVEVEILD